MTQIIFLGANVWVLVSMNFVASPSMRKILLPKVLHIGYLGYAPFIFTPWFLSQPATA